MFTGSTRPAWYDAGTPLIPSLHQPALVAEHMAAHLDDHLDEHLDDPRAWQAGGGMPACRTPPDAALAAWLAGSGLAPELFGPRPGLLSPAQWLALLARAERSLAAPDTAFELGRMLLPGHHGAASQALAQAAHLGEALHLLQQHAARLSPLLTPRLVLAGPEAVLLWTDAVGLGAQRGFVVDLMMAAVVGMAQWLGGERLPWRLCFNRVAPRRIEQHQAYLGSALRFGCHVDAMILPRELLQRRWPAAGQVGAAARRAARHAADAETAALPRSLLALLHEHLHQQLWPRGPASAHGNPMDEMSGLPGDGLNPAPAVPAPLPAPGQPCTLEHAAAALGTSPATLKRRLAAEGTHFQAELDQVRSHLALYLYRYRGADNAQVAQALGFADVPNFRRSFKRWTGLTPQSLRTGLISPGPAPWPAAAG
ncbi:AraC family transcriptional regulator [Aquabacterium sp. OR-4]|uniref:AraC family transcriptional regulator n=1 Tax=Aquabacterium sp. OR-4 TaxID=2978127 RepID=UPI0021B2FBCD|nr:AraC family transcriptional regulator [Aquabacterium sp. OR-4]MDT7838220.1 AraC family transcriptional regulator ligand-binding domain-containing protein [Aquabacterium sp. OR-4]